MDGKVYLNKIINYIEMKVFESVFYKYKEVILYLFFGVLTFIISVLTYMLFNIEWGINELLSNLLSWVIAVLFAFFTNRIWVFSATTTSVHVLVKQMISFFGGRVLTLIIEELILLLFITLLGFPSLTIKIIAQGVVIFLNYLISKLIVFKSR